MYSKFFCFIVLLYTTMLKKERTKKKMQWDLFILLKPDKEWLSNMSADTIFAYYKVCRFISKPGKIEFLILLVLLKPSFRAGGIIFCNFLFSLCHQISESSKFI